MLKTYLRQISNLTQKGDAREESYYKALAPLLEDYALSVRKSKADVTILPKKTEVGNPDFHVWDARQHIIGYIEAKRPEEENLDKGYRKKPARMKIMQAANWTHPR